MLGGENLPIGQRRIDQNRAIVTQTIKHKYRHVDRQSLSGGGKHLMYLHMERSHLYPHPFFCGLRESERAVSLH